MGGAAGSGERMGLRERLRAWLGVTAIADAQHTLVREILRVTSVQAEANARIAVALDRMMSGWETTGLPEGRPGLSDEAEAALEQERDRG